MLDPTQLAAMQSKVAETFDATATIERHGTTIVATGMTEGWTPIATNVPCRAAPSPRLPKEVVIGDQEQSSQYWILNMPVSTGPSDPSNFGAKDRFVITWALHNTTLTFEVIAPVPARSMEVDRRAILQLVNQ